MIRDTPEVRASCVAGLVGLLWRCVLAACNTLLARAAHDVLVGLLVRGLQVSVTARGGRRWVGGRGRSETCVVWMTALLGAHVHMFCVWTGIWKGNFERDVRREYM